jgi:hypothetical protein
MSEISFLIHQGYTKIEKHKTSKYALASQRPDPKWALRTTGLCSSRAKSIIQAGKKATKVQQATLRSVW